MMLGWIIGVLVLVLLVASFNKGLFQKGTPLKGERDVLSTLKNRYAKGEIDTAEFEARKAELEKLN